MAAGDLVVADFTWEIRTTLFGVGTNYQVSLHNIDGLGVPQTKTADVELDQANGSYGSPDYQGVRVIIFPLIFKGTASAVGGYAKTWQTTLWTPASADEPLYGQLPGFGKFHVNGRPRGIDFDITRIKSGLITAEATFVCLDPTITYP